MKRKIKDEGIAGENKYSQMGEWYIIKELRKQAEYYEMRIKKIDSEYIKKIDQLKKRQKNKIEKERNLNSNDRVILLNEKLLKKTTELSIAKNELKSYRNETRSSSVILKSLRSDKEALLMRINKMEIYTNELELKVSNLQKYIKDKELHINKSEITSNLSENITPTDMSLGSSEDGSKGWHSERRESGRFGSLPSFDNYDDDYTEGMPDNY